MGPLILILLTTGLVEFMGLPSLISVEPLFIDLAWILDSFSQILCSCEVASQTFVHWLLSWAASHLEGSYVLRKFFAPTQSLFELDLCFSVILRSHNLWWNFSFNNIKSFSVSHFFLNLCCNKPDSIPNYWMRPTPSPLQLGKAILLRSFYITTWVKLLCTFPIEFLCTTPSPILRKEVELMISPSWILLFNKESSLPRTYKEIIQERIHISWKKDSYSHRERNNQIFT